MDEKVQLLHQLRLWAEERRDDCTQRAEIVMRSYGLTDEFHSLSGEVKAFSAMVQKCENLILDL